MGSAKARVAAMMVSAAALSAAYPAMAQDDLANTLQGCWVQSKTGTLEHAEYALTITTDEDAVEATVPSRNRVYEGEIEDGKLTLTYTLKGAEDLADQSHWTGGTVPSEKIRAQIVEAQPTSRFVVNKVDADQIDVTHFGFLARWTASETLVHIEPKGFGYVWRRADTLKPTALRFMTAGFKGEKDAFTTDDRAALVEAKASQGCDVQIESLTATLVHDAVEGVEKEIVLTETGADTNLFRSEGIALGEDFARLGTLTLSLVKGGPVAQVTVGKDAKTLAAEKAAAEKAAAEKAAAEKAAAEKAAAEKAAAEKAAAEKAAAEKAAAEKAAAEKAAAEQAAAEKAAAEKAAAEQAAAEKAAAEKAAAEKAATEKAAAEKAAAEKAAAEKAAAEKAAAEKAAAEKAAAEKAAAEKAAAEKAAAEKAAAEKAAAEKAAAEKAAAEKAAAEKAAAEKAAAEKAAAEKAAAEKAAAEKAAAEKAAAEKAAAEKAAAEKAAAEKAAAEKAAAEKAAAEKAAAEEAAAEKAEADEAGSDAGTPVQIIPSEDNPEPAAPAAQAETLQDPEALDQPAGETAQTEAEPAEEPAETEADAQTEPAATEWVNPDAEAKRPGIAPANANSFLTPKSAEPAAPAQEEQQDTQAEEAEPAAPADQSGNETGEESSDEGPAQEDAADEVDEAAQAMNDAYRQAYDGWMADINKSKAKIKELEEAAFEADEVDVDGFNERAATERKRLKLLEKNLVSDLKEAAAAFTESGRDVPQWITDALQ